MNRNASIPLGGIVLIDKIDKRFGAFSSVFSGVGDRAKDFIGCVKLHVYNKLAFGVSTHRILETYPRELASYLGLSELPTERTLYRTLERVGRNFPVVHGQYQRLLAENGLVDDSQVIDFSSTYFEGGEAELGEFGYSRDHRPGKKQVTFGVATGINGISSALTVQRGNVQDKKHFRQILGVVSKVLEKESLLVFDCGGNTRANKRKVRENGFHYLTFKAKRVSSYRRHIQYFTGNMGVAESFTVNGRQYFCVKKQAGDETLYVFFCPQLLADQLQAKEKKFLRMKEKGGRLLKKRKPARIPCDKGWVMLEPHLQKTLHDLDNPYINGLEGYFILESSVDDDPEKILRLYKERDKAEKFIRALKEGLELRPIRHWSRWAIIGLFFVCFLTNFLINLTQKLADKTKDAAVKNVKLLKKFLNNLTLTVVYPKNRFKFTVLSNVSPQINALFGDFVWKYGDKTLDLRW